MRVALAVALSPAFERFRSGVQRRLRCNAATAFGATVLVFNVAGSFGYMFAAIRLATWATGTPLMP